MSRLDVIGHCEAVYVNFVSSW